MAEAVNPWDVAWEAPATTGAAPWEQKWDEPQKGAQTPDANAFSFTSDLAKARKSVKDQGALDLLDSVESQFKSAKVGESVYLPFANVDVVKTGDDAYQSPDYKGPRISAEDALAQSAVMGVIPGAAGMRAAGAIAKALPNASNIVRGGASILGAAGAGMGVGVGQQKLVEAVNPEKANELAIGAQDQPAATLAGSLLGGNAPFQKLAPSVGVTLRSELLQRGLGGGIAGGIQAASDVTLGDGLNAGNIGGAVLGGALFNDPTKLGGKVFSGKVSNPITSRLGSVKAGDPLPKVVANTNEIALSGPSEPPPVQLPGMDAESRLAMDADLRSRPFGPRDGAPKATQEKLDTKATIPDPETGAPITVDLAGPLGDFEPTEPFIPKKLTDTEVFNRRVKGVIDNLAKEGVEIDRQTAVKLARTTDRKEFNAARQKLIDSIKPPEIPAEGPLEKAETKAVSEQTPEEAAAPKKAVEAPAPEPQESGEIQYTIQREQEYNGRKIPGYIQIERQANNGRGEPLTEAQRSASPKPPDWLPTGQYTEAQVLKAIEDGPPDSTPVVAEPAKVAETPVAEPVKIIKDPVFPLTPAEPDAPAPYTDKEGNFVRRGKKGWEIVDPEAGAVLNIVTPTLEAAARGVSKAKDFLAEGRRGAIEVNKRDAGNGLFDSFSPLIEDEPQVEFAKPGEGRKQTKAERRALEDTSSYEGDLLPVKDSITGERIPENEAANAKTIYERMTAKAKESNSLEIEKADADAIAKVPEHYVPMLTDLASRFPKLGNNPIGKSISRKIGWLAEVAKNRLGLSEDNIGDVLPAAKGKVYERDHFIGKLTNRLVGETEEFGRKVRKNLTKEEFMELDKAALSGDEERIAAVYKNKSAGPELQAAYEKNQAAKAAARQMLIEAGRDVGEVDAYFQRIIHDREGLIKELGSEVSLYNDAIRKATETKGSALTPEEEIKVLNNLVLGSLRHEGGPGFLKKRTIETITDNIHKFYEPFDVADARWAVRVARDIGNRKFFGKIEPDAAGIYTEDSSFGKTISQALKSGELTDRGLKILKDNLEDLYKNDRKFNEAIEKIGSAARKAQTYAYLADVGTALVQFADVFSIAREYGVSSALKGYSGKKLDIRDIGATEGHNPDMLELSRVPKSKIGKVIDAPYRWSMKNLIGLADGFQKSATVKAATARISKEANTKGSGFFERLEADYKKIFPDKWPQMKKDLQSKDFANGKLNENTSLFLFSELSRLQPINASGRAQGYQTAGSWGKALYALRSYWLKQVGILRNQAYNEAKRGRKGEGARALATYITVVAVGQQAFQVIKDKVLQREVAPEDYAIGGMLQLAGIPRYAIYRQKQVGTGTAALETLVPGIGLLNDLGNDTMLAMKGLNGSRKDGGKAVRGLGDFLEQAESTKYIPAVGREIYSLAGKGKLKEQKERQRIMDGGKPRATTIEEISNFFAPPDLESR